VLDQKSIGNKLNYVIESTIPTITNFPIISKGSDWVRVNDILITQKNDRYKVTRKGIFLEEFYKRSWAVAYSVSLCQSDYSACAVLKANNHRLGKYLEEIERYSYHLEHAQNRGDYSKEKIISDRLSRTLGEYELILEEVSPLIKSQVVV
jgi:hypothetical protein